MSLPLGAEVAPFHMVHLDPKTELVHLGDLDKTLCGLNRNLHGKGWVMSPTVWPARCPGCFGAVFKETA